MNGNIMTLSLLGTAYGRNCKKMKSQEVLNEMHKLTAGQNEGNPYFGHVYAAMGEWDPAFGYFDKSVRNHEGHLLTMTAVFRFWYPEMRNDPRTRQLLEE